MTTTMDYLQDRTCRNFIEPGFSLKKAIAKNILIPPVVGAVAWVAHRLFFQSPDPAQYAILWSCCVFASMPIGSIIDFLLGKDMPPLEESSKKEDEDIIPPIDYTREITKTAL